MKAALYADAIRTGRNVLARTEAEIEALGRTHLRQAELQQAQTRATAEAIRSGVEAGADSVRRGVAVVVPKVRAAAKAQADVAQVRQTQQARAQDEAVRFATMPPAPFLRQGTPADPGPGRVYEEFRTGRGPEYRTLGPETSFSREFVQAPNVKDYIQETLSKWQARNGGEDMFVNPRRREFGRTEFIADLGNGPSHLIGTFDLAGERRGDAIDWTAHNDMGQRSFFGGRLLQKVGFSGAQNLPRPGPRGTTHQAIMFRTDLQGRPLPQR